MSASWATVPRLATRHTIGYEYDNLDRVVRRTVNGADPTIYTYDNASRLTKTVLGGWQVNSIMTVESGVPLALSAPGVNGIGNRPNAKAGVPYKDT